MSADPNPVDRLEQAATQFKDSGVIQLAVRGLLFEGVARDLRRCDAATVGCVELSAWLNRGIRELELFCFNVCSTGSAVFFRSVG
ncbi:hypothetical protein LF920_03445 [Bifidobacterium longum]|uniref:hypothetical protein n=1 Tax=Bifidobacterium longum TaxID=216816 RepID=UPI001F118D72|nr:hypothetical protein [Bifidobacterium longum]MCH4847767.1 hypothetical protein [Bifidobacterium longum]